MNTTSGTVNNIKRIQGALQILATLQLTGYLWPQQAFVNDGAKFDFIVVGAGSTGCVIASRLSENANITVLLIEAGGDPPIESMIPGLFPYLKKSDADWNYKTANDGYSQQFHKNGMSEWTSGKVLGGSSSINYMAYTRGIADDYDEWARILGDEIWSYENVLPYFEKSEHLIDPVVQKPSHRIYHEAHGPLGITKNYKEETVKYLKAFAEAGHDVDFDTIADTRLGYTEFLFTIADGTKQSSAYSYLRQKRPNLFVLKHTLASKIIFDEHKNAICVEAILENNKTVLFKAMKEVIISAGAVRSPQLLMLSGIGPKNLLENNKIKIISDLPVGQNLQDHVYTVVLHRMGKSPPPKPMNPTSFPFPAILGFVAFNNSQPSPDYESFNIVISQPSYMLQFCAYLSYIDEICEEIYNLRSVGRETLFTVVSLLHPKSRGKIVLQSLDIRDQPLIYPGYYSNQKDIENHARYIEDFVRVAGTQVFKSLGANYIVPKTCGCSNFQEEHEFWKCYTLCMMNTGYKYSGTCAMGSVVDSRLRVKGVNRLRVADASIMPKLLGANINAATIMIGEKISDIVKEYHGC